jgi:hypothetical protein
LILLASEFLISDACLESQLPTNAIQNWFLEKLNRWKIFCVKGAVAFLAPAHFTKGDYATFVDLSNDGFQDVLVSYGSEHIYSWKLNEKTPTTDQTYIVPEVSSIPFCFPEKLKLQGS